MEKQFGERLKFIREMRGMTQTELAEKIETGPAVISHMESGNRLPGVPNLRAICRSLFVSADYLLGLSERPNP